MKKDRRMTGQRGQQGIVRARFLAVAFLLVMLCLGDILYAAGVLRGMPAAFLPAGEGAVKETYDARASSLGVVKLVCGDFRGSGVVIAVDADGVVIVSAKHLLMYDVQAQVSFAGMGSNEQAAGDSVTGNVIGYSASYDLAYLHVPRSALPDKVAAQYEEWLGGAAKEAFDIVHSEGAGGGGADNAQSAADRPGDASDPEWAVAIYADGTKTAVRTDHAYRELRAGDFIVQIGMSENAFLECNMGTAQAKEVFISDYNASMLLNECYAEAGMSGGGAFDENGRLTGIIIAGDAQGTVCMPMTTVLNEYRELMY